MPPANRSLKIFVVSTVLTAIATLCVGKAIQGHFAEKYSWRFLFQQTEERVDLQIPVAARDEDPLEPKMVIEAILNIAVNARNNGNLALAMALVEDISRYSEWSTKTEPFLKLLEEDRVRFNQSQQKALLALAEQRLADAVAIAKDLPDYPPWSETKSLVSVRIDESLEAESVTESNSVLRWAGPIILGFMLALASVLFGG